MPPALDRKAEMVLPDNYPKTTLPGHLVFVHTDFLSGKTEMKNISESVWCGEVEVNQEIPKPQQDDINDLWGQDD